MPQFRELAMLRAYYAGSLELPTAAAAELLRMTGERGRRTCDRLNLPADSTREQLLEHASARLKYWRIRQVGGGFVGPTRETVRLLARSYERMVEQIRDLRWTEER
jgi:hypothetical protein